MLAKCDLKRMLALFAVAIAVPVSAQEAAWWEPVAPIYGQQFTVYYDDAIGTLPTGTSECWLHWGVVDPVSGNWSAPPESSWPPGSQIAPDAFACQSPMNRGGDDIWEVAIDPDETITLVEFVLTDMQDNWDNNNGENWRISFVSGDEASWWYPEEPLPGDLLTIFYNTNAGTLPSSAQDVKLHWGINEAGAGNWVEPPQSMWPPGTIPWGDQHAVQTPMTNIESGIWMVEIQTNDTTYTLHYVVTDGTNWDNNNNQNWNITLEEPPPIYNTYYTFRYDTRSAFATYGINDISSIFVAGTFNNWSSMANPLQGPDENGVYSTELHVPATTHTYKIVINGNLWMQDPDNPIIDGSNFGNSLIVLEPDTLPYFTQVQPPEGTIIDSGAVLDIEALVRTSDIGPGVSGDPTLQLNGMPIPVTYNSSTGILTASTQVNLVGVNLLTFTVEDSSGNVGVFNANIGVYAPGSGFHAVDDQNDDTGLGSYTYPTSIEDAADFELLKISEISGGDSIAFEIYMAEISEETRILMQICTDVGGFYYTASQFDTEIATPDWNGNGVQFCLADPASPDFDPEVHNVLFTHRDPLITGSEITLDPDALLVNVFHFVLSVDDLEDILGSYNRGWYYGAYAFIEGPAGTSGRCWEVDTLHGGWDEIYDPDAFDAMFMDSREMQRIIFNNSSQNRQCTLDNEGRGFALIYPEMIGPNVGSSGPVIDILTRGALTIEEEQSITGVIDVGSPTQVIVYQDVGLITNFYIVPDVTDTFEVDLTLEEGSNTIWAEATVGGETGISPSILFDLYIEQAPQPEITVSVDGNTVTLDASASTDPQGDDIVFEWTPDASNPEPISLTNPNSAICTFETPDTPGEYYVDLLLEDTEEHQSYARTLATVYSDSVHPFEWNESVRWVQDALVYEIYPRSYSSDHQFTSISADMQRIHDMGFNAIWLMPINPGPTGHGYHIVDYYGIEEDYGTEADFIELVETAHDWDIKIILDLVINHTAIEHPFMQDAIAYDTYSHYWDYYDRDASGNYTYYYDWITLPNLNYDNPEVWWEFINVSKYWVENYDIDGFRCDVAWGPQSRNPDFWIAWRDALKTIKPEIFLLAEATSTDFTYFDYRFDSAMDWNLHHEAEYSLQNMFPGPPNLDEVHQIIINYGYPYPQYHYPLRFMENHDEERFINIATPTETKLAATLIYTIPGIPQIYAGQEIGTTSQRGQILWYNDPYEMAEHYYKLGQIRNMLPATRTSEIERLDNTQYSTVYSYYRYEPGENPVIAVLNFAGWSQVVTVDVPIEDLGIDPEATYYLNELLGGTYTQRLGADLVSITTSLDAKKARVYAIADSILLVGVQSEEPPEDLPEKYHLAQNYPNPFNAECRIAFELPETEKVKLEIYNLMGQRVKILADNVLQSGRHHVTWNGRNDYDQLLSSGVYFYRMTAGDFTQIRKMILLK